MTLGPWDGDDGVGLLLLHPLEAGQGGQHLHPHPQGRLCLSMYKQYNKTQEWTHDFEHIFVDLKLIKY